jgi:hypothetical protein
VKVGFTGSRHGITQHQRDTLEKLLTGVHVDELHHGDCVGADAAAAEIANGWGIEVHLHPPIDPRLRAFTHADVTYHPRPYLGRNYAIVDACDWMIACPSGPERRRSGTWAAVRYARSRAVPLTIVWPDGTTT